MKRQVNQDYEFEDISVGTTVSISNSELTMGKTLAFFHIYIEEKKSNAFGYINNTLFLIWLCRFTIETQKQILKIGNEKQLGKKQFS